MARSTHHHLILIPVPILKKHVVELTKHAIGLGSTQQKLDNVLLLLLQRSRIQAMVHIRSDAEPTILGRQEMVLVLFLSEGARARAIRLRLRLNDQLALQALNVFLLRHVEVHRRLVLFGEEEFGALVQVEGGFDGEGARGVVGEQTGGDCAFEAGMGVGERVPGLVSYLGIYVQVPSAFELRACPFFL